MSTAAGVGASPISAPQGAVAGAAGDSVIDQPKALAKENIRLENDRLAENAAQLEKIKGREVQEGAEKDAATDLARKRKKQSRRRQRAKNRGGSLLTEGVEGLGGSSTGKTLIGE